MATINPIDFEYRDGAVRYDGFRLHFDTTGLPDAETAIIEAVEDAGFADTTVYGVVTITSDPSTGPHIRFTHRKLDAIELPPVEAEVCR